MPLELTKKCPLKNFEECIKRECAWFSNNQCAIYWLQNIAPAGVISRE